MAKSLLNIRTQVRSFLDEVTAADWTNAELNVLINAAYHKVYSGVVDVFEDYAPISKANTTTVASQQEYSLPSDFLKMRRVEINYSTASGSVASRAVPINMDD